METSEVVLSYIEAFLAAPVLYSVVAIAFIIIFKDELNSLLKRIAKIKFPGGTEVSTQSAQGSIEGNKADTEPKLAAELHIQGLPSDLSPEHLAKVQQLVRSHKVTARIWEYRYLYFYLVRTTQEVLDWFVDLREPVAFAYFDTFWMPRTPSANERQVIIDVLQQHHLLHMDNSSLITVTEKGREYQQWRGPLLPLER